MTNISGMDQISGLKGFNQEQYDQLIQETKKNSVSVELVNKKLVEAMSSGTLGFTDAVKSVSKELPTLPPPLNDGSWLTTSSAFGMELPSPGAMMLALIGDVSEEQRKGARDARNLQTEQIITEMNNQAKEIRSQAKAQLIMGITAGVLQVAQGLGSAWMMRSGIKDVNTKLAADKVDCPEMAQINYQTNNTLLNSKVTAFNSAFGGVVSGVQAGEKFVGASFEAKRKEMDARIESMRSYQDAIKDLEDKLKEVVVKSRDAMSAIQHSTNETRRNIMKA